MYMEHLFEQYHFVLKVLRNYFLQVFLEMVFVLMKEMYEVFRDDQRWTHLDYLILNSMAKMDLYSIEKKYFDREFLIELYQVVEQYEHDLMYHRSGQCLKEITQ